MSDNPEIFYKLTESDLPAEVSLHDLTSFPVFSGANKERQTFQPIG